MRRAQGGRVRETVTSPERTSKEREACTVPRSAGRSAHEGMHKKCTIAHGFAYLKEKIRQRKHTESNRSRSGMSEILEHRTEEGKYMIDARGGVMLLAPDLATLE